jgi:hypothetical protein
MHRTEIFALAFVCCMVLFAFFYSPNIQNLVHFARVAHADEGGGSDSGGGGGTDGSGSGGSDGGSDSGGGTNDGGGGGCYGGCSTDAAGNTFGYNPYCNADGTADVSVVYDYVPDANNNACVGVTLTGDAPFSASATYSSPFPCSGNFSFNSVSNGTYNNINMGIGYAEGYHQNYPQSPITVSCTVPPAPATGPTSLTASCNDAANTVDLNWSGGSAPGGYQLVDYKTGGDTCPTGWGAAAWSSGVQCYYPSSAPWYPSTSLSATTFGGGLEATNEPATFVVTPADSSGALNYAAADSVTFNCTPADLSAGGISPGVATALVPSTFTTTVSNSGAGSTGTGFHVLFRVATQSNGSDGQDIAAINAPALAVRSNNNLWASVLAGVLGSDANENVSDSYTFPSAGTYYMQACANKINSTTFDSVQETNYANDCGPWTSISVAPPPGGGLSGNCTNASDCSVGGPSPTCASPDGCNVTFTWSCPNPPYVGSTGQGFSTGGALSGSVPQSVTQTGTYAVTCDGSTPSGDGPPDAIQVTVPQPQLSLTASPTRVHVNSPTTLTWSADGVSVCSVAGPGVSANTTSGTATPTITGQSTYTLSCTGKDNNNYSVSTVVSLIPVFIER